MENKCPHCGCDLPKSAAFCMHCFSVIAPQSAPYPEKVKRRKFTGAVIGLCLLVLVCSTVTALALSRQTQPPLLSSETESIFDSDTTAFPSVTLLQENGSDAPESTPTTALETIPADSTAAFEQTTAATTTSAVANPAGTTTQQAATTKATTQKSTTAKSEEATPAEVMISDGTLTYYPADKKDRSYTIPYSVSTISRNAFNNPYLQTLTFSKRERLSCDWENLFAGLPNLKAIYIYAGTDADTQGMHYFDGEIIYYYE